MLLIAEREPNRQKESIALLTLESVGQFLGLPIPPCGTFVEAGKRDQPYFGTLNFNIAGDSLPPADPDECLKAYSDPKYPRPDVVAGTLLFDIWIANGDRHSYNLSLDRSVRPAQLHIFDHGWSLFGRERERGVSRLNRLRDGLGVSETNSASGNRHCLLDSVRSNKWFPFWLDRLKQIPDFVVRDAVDRAHRIQLLKGDEVQAANSFLLYRKANLAGIIQKSRDEFVGIPQNGWTDL